MFSLMQIDNLMLPPTLFDLMESIVNYGKPEEEKVKIKDLPANAREQIFDFTYPISSHINKEDFEIQILKHFMMRRIGFETFTAFQIMLDNKLNEVMPKFNQLFDALEDWNIFKGESYRRDYEDNSESEGNSNNKSSGSDKSDRRFSDTPQNQLTDVQEGKYITEYNFDNGESNVETEGKTDSKSKNIGFETTTRSVANESDVLMSFQSGYTNIMTLVYHELESLFYGLIY